MLDAKFLITTLADSKTTMTPLNLLLSIVVAILIYYRLRTPRLPAHPKDPPSTVFRTFTPPELVAYNGTNGYPVYLAVRGKVFDVTSGSQFYGPGGPYNSFSGHDASRGLAVGSFDEDVLTKKLDGPLDTLDNLSEDELGALSDWEARFTDKYLVVGRLVAVNEKR